MKQVLVLLKKIFSLEDILIGFRVREEGKKREGGRQTST